MLSELGYNDREINAAFGWETTGRYLRKIKQTGRLDGSGLVRLEPGAMPRANLAPEFAAMLDWEPDAFIAFYDFFNHQPMPEHCREWVYEAFANDLLMLNVPPRHNKSTVFSIWWPVWNIVRDRDCQVLILSETGTLSSRWVGYIASLLSFGDIPQTFGRFKPDKADSDIPWRPSKGELMVLGRTRQGGGMQFSVLSRSAGAQILGFEADMIVSDDVTSKKIAVSPAGRDQQIEWFQEEVMSRLQPEGRALVIGQRVHVQDLYGHLAEQIYEKGPMENEPIWTVITHPAIEVWPEREDMTDAVVLWPEVWPYERLMKSYALVGGMAPFTTMYQQDPQAADATLVREAWLEGCRDYDRSVGRGFKNREDGRETFLPIVRVCSLDPSPTQYNGLVVADVIAGRGGQFFLSVIDVMSFKADWRSIRETIMSVCEAYNPTYFIFEKNIAQYWAKGDPFIDELRGITRVLEHTTSASNKFDVETGLESLSFDFETGRVRLPYLDAKSRNTSKILEDEARNWSREGRRKDDVLMALWFIKFNWRKLIPLHHLATSFEGTHPEKQRSWRDRYRKPEPQRDLLTL